MREIKFRAWHIEEPDMCFYLPSDSFSLIIHDTGNNIVMWGDGEVIDEFETSSVDQFTGLQDSNGVDIYEGDILSIDRDNGSPVENREIKYLDGCAEFNIEGYLAFIGKVIGNIHQNPELLEEES